MLNLKPLLAVLVKEFDSIPIKGFAAISLLKRHLLLRSCLINFIARVPSILQFS